MEQDRKRLLKAIVLELRHELEGRYDSKGNWQPGDIERRLASLGVWRSREPKAAGEMAFAWDADRAARGVVDAYLSMRAESGTGTSDAVAEFVRETAYTWANRLLALRCMEARHLIDEIVLQKPVYGGRSLEHHRLIRGRPELAAAEDDGLFAAFHEVFARQAAKLPRLFDPHAPGIALTPSIPAMRRAIALLSGTETVSGQPAADADLFTAPDTLGWAYQFYQQEEKDRVDDCLKTRKGFKCEGADIIPKTSLYTESYIVRYLVQNALGAHWMAMHSDSRLSERWEYFVRQAARVSGEVKRVEMLRVLDPAVGSGHFLLEAFDLLYDMYVEEGPVTGPGEICAAILEKNLFGIDIDERAVQIAEAALWMKAAERAPGFSGTPKNLVAANIHLPRGGRHLERFLARHPEDRRLEPALHAILRSLEHADELGSLLRLEEPVDRELQRLEKEYESAVAAGGAVQQNFFPETPFQGQLPVGVPSHEQWKADVMARLEAHVAAEAVSADPRDAFFGRSIARGVSLFELLSQRYDVVVTNPPYMGSKHMGALLKTYVEQHYAPGKRDLYAAFILRCLELAHEGGRVGMVTQQSWMFLRTYAALRAVEEEKLEELPEGAFKGLLRGATIETVAHLGEHAFEEPAAAGAFVALFTLSGCCPDEGHMLAAIRAIAGATPEAKRAFLREPHPLYRIPLTDLLALPEAPLVYWATDGCLRALTRHPRVYGVADVRQGMATTDNVRFVRFSWEAPTAARWVPYAKAGGYSKWAGFGAERLDWYADGMLLKQAVSAIGGQHWSRRLASHDRYFQAGLTYTLMARGAMGCRDLPPGFVFDVASMCIFPHGTSSIEWLLVPLNTHLVSHLLRLVTQDLKFHSGYVGNLYVPPALPRDKCAEIARSCIDLKRELLSYDIVDPNFAESRVTAATLKTAIRDEQVHVFGSSALLHTLEGEAELIARDAYEFGPDDVAQVCDETGVPCGWLPAIAGRDAVPASSDSRQVLGIVQSFSNASRVTLAPDVVKSLKAAIRSQFESGTQPSPNEADEQQQGGDDEDAAETSPVGGRIPIRAETGLEELSTDLGFHPISVYWLLKEGIEQEGWRCRPEDRRITSDRLTVTILRLLGHRWPKQIDAGEAVPGWADDDGVIPLTEGAGERTLGDRVRERIAADFQRGRVSAVEAEFTEIMEQSLDQWLTVEFLGHHTRQFKKRPIAWQLQSGRYTARLAPAFACLVYYHKIDGDLLPKIRSQYVGPIRQRFETELRGIEDIPRGARSARQEARRAELLDRIEELRAFDARLADVVASGFGPTSQLPRLRQLALDDAILALKARWLGRLGDTIAQGPLAGWRLDADATELDPDFGAWVADAFAHVDHFCAALGAGAPDAVSLEHDPGSGDLAPSIQACAAQMVQGTFRLACGRWRKRFDDIVITPLAERLKAATEELKALEKAHPRGTVASLEVRERREELRAEIKELKVERAKKNDAASRLADRIQSWTCPEAETWGDWLGAQPLYDRWASLDGRRPFPQTIQEFVAQERAYVPDANDGVRVNIAPLQAAGVLADVVLDPKDVVKAIADRAQWRADERRWCREGKLPRPGWWTQSQ